MPKSKRNKQVSLTKTHKKPLELKKHLVEEIHSSVDQYANIFLFSVNHMRNSRLKDVREQWKHSRFFFGKNKVMALALGRSAEEEYKTNLHKISKRLRGQCGLLFSNRAVGDVLKWFNAYSESDFARSGDVASWTVTLPEGPVNAFHHSQEPYLRTLGLPTTLKRGVVHSVKEYQVCKEGEILTPEKAKILELLGHQMAEFRITVDSYWSNDGSFTSLKNNILKHDSENQDMEAEECDSEGTPDEEQDVENLEPVEGSVCLLQNGLNVSDKEKPVSNENIKIAIEVTSVPKDDSDEEMEAMETDVKAEVEQQDVKTTSSVEDNVNVEDEDSHASEKDEMENNDLAGVPDQVDEVQVYATKDLTSEHNSIPLKESSLAPDNVDSDKHEITEVPLNDEDEQQDRKPKPKTRQDAIQETDIAICTTPQDARPAGKRVLAGAEGESDIQNTSVSKMPSHKRKCLKQPSKKSENTPVERTKIQEKKIESSPDEQSPVFRSLRNRTVKIKRKK